MKIRDIFFKYKNAFIINNIGEESLQLLLCYLFNYESVTDLILHYDNDVVLTKKHNRMLLRVLNGIPVQQVIKEAYFYNMKFYINKDVLIPRPETEELVFETLKEINNKFREDISINIFEFGVGSGAISLAIDKNLTKKHTIYGIDNSFKALRVANKNKKLHRSNVRFFYGNKLESILRITNKIQVFLSNPPYISNKNEVDQNVIKNEPNNALFIYPSYKYYEYILNNIDKYLDKKFIIVLEIGYDQKNIVESIFKRSTLSSISNLTIKKDINGKERIVIIESNEKSNI